MNVELVVSSGSNAGQSIPIQTPKFFIGRADDCQLRPNSDLVSRHHCVILVEDGFIAVRDFGSKNGTFVNGEQVTAEQELKSGDALAIGQLELEVRFAVEVGGQKKPKVTSVQEAAERTVESAAAEKPKSDDDEVDVSSWLGGDESAKSHETKTVEYYDVSADTMENQVAEETVPAEPEPEKKRADKGKKGTPGKPKKSSVNSQDAAANMLKNFFRGR